MINHSVNRFLSPDNGIPYIKTACAIVDYTEMTLQEITAYEAEPRTPNIHAINIIGKKSTADN